MLSARSPIARALIAALVLSATPAAAETSWTGTGVSLRNTVSKNTLDEGAEPDYNPYYAISLGLAPRFNIDDIYLRAGLSVVQEITQGSATADNRALLSDLTLGVGASPLFEDDLTGIRTGIAFDVQLPTSEASQTRTLIIGLRPSVSVSRTFDLLSGLTIGGSGSVTRFEHEETTARRDGPTIRGCSEGAAGCDPFLNTGVRNAEWRLVGGLSLSLGVTEWMGLSTSASVIQDYLHDELTDPRTSLETVPQADTRELMSYDVAASFSPPGPVNVTVGMATTNPQLAPDSTYYEPFYNRYTTFYLDLRLDLGTLLEDG